MNNNSTDILSERKCDKLFMHKIHFSVTNTIKYPMETIVVKTFFYVFSFFNKNVLMFKKKFEVIVLR